jgi:hypothetical protein
MILLYKLYNYIQAIWPKMTFQDIIDMFETFTLLFDAFMLAAFIAQICFVGRLFFLFL